MAKAVREADGKAILANYFSVLRADSSEGAVGKTLQFPLKSATVRPDTDFSKLVKEQPWLETEVNKDVDGKTYVIITYKIIVLLR